MSHAFGEYLLHLSDEMVSRKSDMTFLRLSRDFGDNGAPTFRHAATLMELVAPVPISLIAKNSIALD
jgi:hypothetical protein